MLVLIVLLEDPRFNGIGMLLDYEFLNLHRISQIRGMEGDPTDLGEGLDDSAGPGLGDTEVRGGDFLRTISQAGHHRKPLQNHKWMGGLVDFRDQRITRRDNALANVHPRREVVEDLESGGVLSKSSHLFPTVVGKKEFGEVEAIVQGGEG